MKKTLIIIPAYNEEENATQVIKKIKKALPLTEVLAVNDGSSDQTAEIAESHGAKVISHPFNMGYGVALQTGYKYALQKGYQFVAQLDADGQHESTFLPDLLAVVKNGAADVALGSRYLEKKNIYKTSLSRKLGTLFFAKIISCLIGQKITDPTSGFQALNRKVMQFYTTDVYPNDFPDADVILMLHFAGFKIKEVPVKMYPSLTGKSIHQGLKPIYYFFKMCLSIFLTLFREKKKLKRSE